MYIIDNVLCECMILFELLVFFLERLLSFIKRVVCGCGYFLFYVIYIDLFDFLICLKNLFFYKLVSSV